MSQMVNRVDLTADSASERASLPMAQELTGGLLLVDWGYFDTRYLRGVDEAGGFFIVRGKTDITPLIVKAVGPDGRELKRFRDQRLKTVKHLLSNYDCVDLTVCFSVRSEKPGNKHEENDSHHRRCDRRHSRRLSRPRACACSALSHPPHF